MDHSAKTTEGKVPPIDLSFTNPKPKEQDKPSSARGLGSIKSRSSHEDLSDSVPVEDDDESRKLSERRSLSMSKTIRIDARTSSTETEGHKAADIRQSLRDSMTISRGRKNSKSEPRTDVLDEGIATFHSIEEIISDPLQADATKSERMGNLISKNAINTSNSSALRKIEDTTHEHTVESPPVVKKTTVSASKSWDTDQNIDALLVTGELPNKFKYKIYPHHSNSQSASLRLLVKVGSLCETPEELGFAHLVEHLVFVTGHNADAESIFDYMVSIGLQFGADANAETSVDFTTYKLEVPLKQGGFFHEKTEEHDMMTRALKVLAAWASVFDPTQREVTNERVVVEEEWRLSQGLADDLGVRLRKLLWKNTPLHDREPIGSMDVIRKAKASAVKNFFDKWYRPENMTLVLLGEIGNTDRVADLITAAFSPLKGSTTVPAGVYPPLNSTYTGQRVFCDSSSHPELENAHVFIDFTNISQNYKKKKLTAELSDRTVFQVMYDLALTRIPGHESGIVSSETEYENWISTLGLETRFFIELDPPKFKQGIKFIFTELGRLLHTICEKEDLEVLNAFFERLTSYKHTRDDVLRDLLNHVMYGVGFEATEDTRQMIFQYIKELSAEGLHQRLNKNVGAIFVYVTYPDSMAASERLSNEEISAMCQEAIIGSRTYSPRQLFKEGILETSRVVPEKLDEALIVSNIHTYQLANGINLRILEQEESLQVAKITATSLVFESHSLIYAYMESEKKLQAARWAVICAKVLGIAGVKWGTKNTWHLDTITSDIFQNSITLKTLDLQKETLEKVFTVIHNLFTNKTEWDVARIEHELKPLKKSYQNHQKTHEEIFRDEILKFNYNNHHLMRQLQSTEFDIDEAYRFLKLAFQNPAEYDFSILLPKGVDHGVKNTITNVALRYLGSLPTLPPSHPPEKITKAMDLAKKDLILQFRNPPVKFYYVPSPVKSKVFYTFTYNPISQKEALILSVLQVVESTLYNKVVRHKGLSYTVEVKSREIFLPEITIEITCKPSEVLNVVYSVPQALARYQSEGMTAKEIEYAKKLAHRNSKVGDHQIPLSLELNPEIGSQIVRDLFSGIWTCVVMTGESQRKQCEAFALSMTDKSYTGHDNWSRLSSAKGVIGMAVAGTVALVLGAVFFRSRVNM